MKAVVFKTDSGCEFRCTQEQADTLDKLETIIKGGLGAVHGYVATSNRIVPETADIKFLTAFSTHKLYARKLAALQPLTYDDVAAYAEKHEKVLVLPLGERIKLFEERKQQEIDSLEKSLSGDRSDAHRQAHDRCYCHVGHGVKVHYRTYEEEFTDENGKKKTRKTPETVAGMPVAASIMLTILEVNKTVTKPGKYKEVNSGASVLIKNAMLKALGLRSIDLKTLSLKEDTFDHLVISRKTILAEDVTSIPAELFLR